MTDGFARRREQSKEEIRKAAWELFSQFGVEKVSIGDISRKAGVSQATIYNNFDSKEALAREFISAMITQLVSRAQAVLSTGHSFWEKLSNFTDFITGAFARGNTGGMELPAFISNSNLLIDPDVKRIRDLAQEKMTELLLGLVREGKQEGHIRPDLSDDAFRIYFQAFMDIFAAPQFRQRYAQDPNLVKDLGKLMVFGMSGKEK